MNIYVMVDAEGLCGIQQTEQVLTDGPRYQELRQLMTDEINVCVAGLKAGGADRIYVRDAHGTGSNVYWDQLSKDAYRYIIGQSGSVRMPGLEDCQAVVLLGYHAMAGTAKAVLEHTMSSKSWQNCWLNDQLSGEVAIDAAIAGEQGRPVIMVSGDDKVCAEAKAIMPDIVTAGVKTGLSAQGAIHLPKAAAYQLIRQSAARAVQLAKEDKIKPYTIKSPVRMRLELVERGLVPSLVSRPDVKIIDGRTYEVTADTVEEALFRL